MNILTLPSGISWSWLAQAAHDAAPPSGFGGTLIVAIACLAAGYVTGLCIWREDRVRLTKAERATSELRARIDTFQTVGK